MNSELSYASNPANAEPEPAPQNLFSRLIGIWFSPGETFAEIGRAPRVLIPTLLVIVLAGMSSYLLVGRYGYENIVRKQMGSPFLASQLLGLLRQAVNGSKAR